MNEILPILLAFLVQTYAPDPALVRDTKATEELKKIRDDT